MEVLFCILAFGAGIFVGYIIFDSWRCGGVF